ncbi:MAG: VOC family protein [Chloroflexi bacterium]|nr:VOC family protein [Chloroflexota bacterium]
MSAKIFVNLPVRDLKKSMAFFTRLGFTFNPVFTDDNAACMVVSEDIYAMLLTERFFKGFIPGKQVCDARTSAEAILALALDSRVDVDQMIRKAVAAGGAEYREAQDHGWMYERAFQDPDGHIWEMLYADMTAIPEEMKKAASRVPA